MKFQKECSYCGKIYKSKRFYKLHVAKHEEPKTVEYNPEDDKVTVEKPKVARKIIRDRVKYRELVYIGTADQATVKGAVTGKTYNFFKDKYNMPVSTKVDERDYPGIVALKGKGCIRRDPTALYMSKNDWNLEIASAKSVNR